MMKRTRTAGAKGFTIVELLVATVVFSVVLLVATAGILQVARVYYKGVTEANTQNTARAIIDDISQAIQFSGGAISNATSTTTGTPLYFCVGDIRFSYVQGWQVENGLDTVKHRSWHGLVQDTPGCNGSTGAQPIRDNQNVTGQDLVGSHMRLSKLTVSLVAGTTNQYAISVRVVYGDDDLLNNPTANNATCRGIRAGTQFCSVADLNTVVIKRVQ